MPRLKIKSISDTQSGKSKKVVFESGEIAYANPSELSDPLTAGHESEAVLEEKSGKDGGSFVVLKQWGAPKASGRGGGGGGRQFVPKSSEEIHASSIAGILKSCIESGKTTEEGESWLKVYFAAAKKVKSL